MKTVVVILALAAHPSVWPMSIGCCVLSSVPLLLLLPWEMRALVSLFGTVPWGRVVVVVWCLSGLSVKLGSLGTKNISIEAEHKWRFSTFWS